jgi:hypothetical protein
MFEFGRKAIEKGYIYSSAYPKQILIINYESMNLLYVLYFRNQKLKTKNHKQVHSLFSPTNQSSLFLKSTLKVVRVP